MRNSTTSLRLVFIGAGNVAWHLGHAFRNAGATITQVISRTPESAESLADSLGASFSTDLRDLSDNNDFCILAVPDHALLDIAGKTSFSNCLLLHTAGSVPIEMLKGRARHYGVLYPLQTLSKNRTADLKQVPLLVEADHAESLARIKALASLISGCVVETRSDDRLKLHLAAVFACNFVNHMYVISEKLLEEKSSGFDLIKPLIRETAAKALDISPSFVQTGPAVRGDFDIMEKHLGLLATDPDLRELYRLISESIGKMKNRG